MGHSVSVVNVLVDKLLDFGRRDKRECFDFNQFGKVVDNHYSVLKTTSFFGELTDQVNPPYCKWPWIGHGNKLFWIGV